MGPELDGIDDFSGEFSEAGDEEVEPIVDEEVEPIGDEEVEPIGDEEVEPIGDEEVEPIGDEEVEPIGDEEVPEQEAQEVPEQEAQEVPEQEAQEVPEQEAPDVPEKENREELAQESLKTTQQAPITPENPTSKKKGGKKGGKITKKGFKIPKIPNLGVKLPTGLPPGSLKNFFKDLLKGDKKLPKDVPKRIGDLYIRHSKLGQLLSRVQVETGLSRQEICKILGVDETHYAELMKNERAVRLQNLIQLTKHPKVQQLSPEEQSAIEHDLTTILNDKQSYRNIGKEDSGKAILDSTIHIERPVTDDKKKQPNQTEEPRFILKNQASIRLPTTEKEAIDEEKEFTDKKIIKHEFGIAIPLECIQQGELIDILSNTNLFENYYIKNPDLGPFLKQMRDDLHLTPAYFNNLLNLSNASFSRMIKNETGINLLRFAQFVEHPRFQKDFILNLGDDLKVQTKKFLSDGRGKIFRGLLYHPELGPYLNMFCEKLGFSHHDFCLLIGKITAPYQKIISNEIGVDPKKLLNIIEDPLIQEMNRHDYAKHLKIQVNKFIMGKNTEIYPGSQAKFNWHYDNTIKTIINDKEYLVFPTSKQEAINILEKKENNKIEDTQNKFQRELKEIFQRDFLENNVVRTGFGVAVSLDYIEKGGLTSALRNILKDTNNSLDKFFIKNPELGPSLEQLRINLQSSKAKFAKLIGKRPAEYSRVVDNREGVRLDGIINLTEKLRDEKLLLQKLTSNDIKNLDKLIEKILIHEDTSIYKRGASSVLNWHPKNLLKFEFGNREYVILPTSIYETKEKLVEMIQYIRSFKEKPLTIDLFMAQFPGVFDNWKKYGITFNKILKSFDLPINLNIEYYWSELENWEIAKNWTQGFYTATSIFNALLGRDGRSPRNREIKKMFGGLMSYLEKNGIPAKEGHIPIYKYNDLLRFWKLPSTNLKESIVEGIRYDAVGKDCINIIFDKPIREPRVFHPILKRFGKKYIEPDGVIHNFGKLPFKIEGNNIKLEDGQKLDKMIEFKAGYTSMQDKDWNVYTLLCNELHVYFLRGRRKPEQINGCKVIYHSRYELLKKLRERITTKNKAKIEELITKIHTIYQGEDPLQQKLTKYINKTKEVV